MELWQTILDWASDAATSNAVRTVVALLAIPGALWGCYLFYRWITRQGIDAKLDAIERAVRSPGPALGRAGEADQEQENDWALAMRANTRAALVGFLEKWPDSKYAAKARGGFLATLPRDHVETSLPMSAIKTDTKVSRLVFNRDDILIIASNGYTAKTWNAADGSPVADKARYVHETYMDDYMREEAYEEYLAAEEQERKTGGEHG